MGNREFFLPTISVLQMKSLFELGLISYGCIISTALPTISTDIYSEY